VDGAGKGKVTGEATVRCWRMSVSGLSRMVPGRSGRVLSSVNLGGGRAVSRPTAAAGIGRTERLTPDGGLAAISNVGEGSSGVVLCWLGFGKGTHFGGSCRGRR